MAVCGEIQTRSYEGQDGQKRYVTEIVAGDVEFLSRPGGTTPRENELGELVDDDEMPF